jgi:segregation and condensation protein B
VDKKHIQCILESALLTTQVPLTINHLKQLFDGQLNNASIEAYLVDLQEVYQQRSIELIEVSTGWRFQTQAKYQPYLDKVNREVSPKYSRAVLETLTIIAYKQPVTRGDIEAIRGVSVATEIIKKLEDRGWIEVIGHRDVLGRPALLATTKKFLDDLSLKNLNELPPLSTSKNPEGTLDVLDTASK